MNHVDEKSDSKILRKSAEEFLLKKPSDKGSRYSEVETRKLIHELEVHQIELEMQNEELQRAKVRAQDASEKYIDLYAELYDFAPSGYFTLSENGEIIELNLSGANMLGKERDQIKKKQFSSFITIDSRPIFDHFLGRVFEGKVKETCEVIVLANGKIPMYVYLTGIASHDKEHCLVNVVDITGHKLADDKLHESERRYKELFDKIKEGFYLAELVYDENGNPCDYLFLDTNPAFEGIMGLNREQIIGRRSKELFPGIKPEWLEVFAQVVRTGEPIHHHSYSDLFNRHFEAYVFKHSENQFAALVTEITESTKSEEALHISEAKYRNLFNASEVGMFRTRLDGSEILDFNQKYLSIINYTLEEIKGKPSVDLWADKNERDEMYKILMAEGHVRDFECGIFTKQGEVRRCLTSLRLYSDSGILEGSIQDITERKKAEEALRENEQRLKFHFENSPLAVVEWDANFIVTQWSSEAERIFGWKKEETLGKHIETLNLIYEVDIPIVNRTMERLTGGKEQMVVSSNRNYTKSGEVIECTWYNSVLLDHDGRMASVMSVVQDITEQKRAEEALRESEERFRVMANSMPQLAWIANADGYIYWYNQGWYDYTGTTPEEMEGWGWQSVHHPEWLPGVMEKWKTSLATEKPFEMVFPLLGKDGKYRSFLTRGLPIFNNEGKLLQWFGTNTDVSELREAEEKLREAREKLNLALDNGNIGIWERDLQTNRSIWDRQTQKMFGLGEGDFDGSYEAFEKCLVEEDIPHTRESIRKAIEEKAPYETVYRVRLKNGDIKYINSKGFVIEDETGRAVKLAGVCFDITDMKKGAEEALFKLNDELLRSNKELEQFAYVASHDLQEPLRMVSSFMRLLSQRYKDKLDEDASQFIHFAMLGAKRSRELINDLLKYSRVGTKGQKFSEVDFNKVLEITLNNLTFRIKDKNAVVTSGKMPTVFGDEVQLVQVLQNLVDNALKFCDKAPRVHISAKERPDHYIFSVSDNGIGIEHEYSEKIFLIFQRLFPKGEYDGSGIGLAICKRIVERHGGNICFESKLGEGTTFYFTIAKNKDE